MSFLYKSEKINCEKCRQELEPNNLEKWKFSLIGTFLVVILFNPSIFRLTQTILSNLIGKISDKSGCPTILGYLLHALVFTLLVRYSMEMNI
jgi:hypothetical protein